MAAHVPTLDGQLREAIARKRLIRFRYHGSVRVAEPHDYGVNNTVVRVLVYQLRGRTPTPGKKARGWRMLDVEKMEECALLEETFPGSRSDSHQQHVAWDVLYARVA